MDEFISRKMMREAFDNADADIVEEYEDGACDWGFGRQNILEVINSVPAADLAPVRHGNWCWEGRFRACSICGSYVEFTETLGASHWKYCPNCGAKMDGEFENG